jgi:hypothetical protein
METTLNEYRIDNLTLNLIKPETMDRKVNRIAESKYNLQASAETFPIIKRILSNF